MSQTPSDQPLTAAEVLAAQAAAAGEPPGRAPTGGAPTGGVSTGGVPPTSAEAPPSPAPAPQQAEGAIAAELTAALATLAEREDQIKRLAAEIENMRRRHATELSNASKYAIESFADAMLPVADSLETALSLPDQTQDGLRAGVELTLRQLQRAFERGRLRALYPVGEKFNPNQHQAVSMVDGSAAQPSVPSGHVVAVMQRGYLMGERVLRPALVVVAQ